MPVRSLTPKRPFHARLNLIRKRRDSEFGGSRCCPCGYRCQNGHPPASLRTKRRRIAHQKRSQNRELPHPGPRRNLTRSGTRGACLARWPASASGEWRWRPGTGLRVVLQTIAVSWRIAAPSASMFRTCRRNDDLGPSKEVWGFAALLTSARRFCRCDGRAHRRHRRHRRSRRDHRLNGIARLPHQIRRRDARGALPPR
jgi:hypothetical protein